MYHFISGYTAKVAGAEALQGGRALCRWYYYDRGRLVHKNGESAYAELNRWLWCTTPMTTLSNSIGGALLTPQFVGLL